MNENTGAVDRDSFEPAYMQIVRSVSQQIADGALHPGDQLPTEGQLRKQFGVSPMTIRRAVGILVKRGLVSTTQGKGTFVKPLDMGKAVFRLQELKEAWEDSNETTLQLLEANILSADRTVADRLAISLGKRVIYIRRLVLRKEMPAMYHREYLVYDPKRPVVEAQLQITSLTGLFQGQRGEGLRRGSLTMEAVNLSQEEATVLQVSAHSAAFSLEHVFYDFDDCPVSWGWFICRADLFSLTAHIGAETDL